VKKLKREEEEKKDEFEPEKFDSRTSRR